MGYLIFAVVLVGVFLFTKKKAPVDSNYVENDYMTQLTGKSPFEDIFREAATREGLEWQLLSAHAYVESTYNPKAHNAEGSYGLMQIFLPLEKNRGALEHFKDGTLDEWRNIDMQKIYDPAYNVGLGAALIRENKEAYGFPRCIAVYNNSKDRGSKQYGPFHAKGYVDKVLKRYNDLKGTQ